MKWVLIGLFVFLVLFVLYFVFNEKPKAVETGIDEDYAKRKAVLNVAKMFGG